MAHKITKQTLEDGRKNIIVKINIKGDGLSADLAAATLFDASDYQIDTTENKLVEIKYCLNSFSAELFWNAAADVPLINLDSDLQEEVCYRDAGGLINNGAAGRNGDINITTSGLAATTDEGYIMLYIQNKAIPDYN